MRKSKPILHIYPIESYFADVVDRIRPSGVITSIVASGGRSTITTANSLSVDDVISIGSVEARVDSATSSEVIVNKEVELNQTSWKALFPYFMDGNVTEIASRLSAKDDSDSNVLKYTKYPLVVLFQDLDFNVSDNEIQTAPVDIAIVNKTNNTYITEQRRAENFTPILDPIYNKLIDAIYFDSKLGILRESEHKVSRKYYWGSIPEDENPFNDFLDAIEIKNLKLEVKSFKC